MSEIEIDAGRSVRDERGQIVLWRIGCLLEAGYDGETALTIAIDFRIDLHDAVGLVQAGCPPTTAARILL